MKIPLVHPERNSTATDTKGFHTDYGAGRILLNFSKI